MFKGNNSLTLSDISKIVREYDLLSYYLNIYKLPCVINSPLREDKNPSFGLYTKDDRIFWVDFATKEKGGIYDLLSQMWHCPLKKVLTKIHKDLSKIINCKKIETRKISYQSNHMSDTTDLQCVIREWQDYDLEYWESYGINKKWLEYAEIYPISYKIVYKNNQKYVFKADKYAYAFVERKENKITLKIYQPFNTIGYKWSNKHDGSVISLWTKVPQVGEMLCICSSVKDALCLWVNTGIPAIAVQGEGYNISETALNVLKSRFNHIYILFDNDKAGIEDAKKLSEKTGFTNIVIPNFVGGKDISDYYKVFGKEQFIKTFNDLFITGVDSNSQYNTDELPF